MTPYEPLAPGAEPLRRLRIGSLCLGSLRRIGGYQVFLYNLLLHLARRGHRVDLYLPHDEWQEGRDFYAGLPFRTVPLLPRTQTLAARCPALLGLQLRWRQWRERYDVWQLVGAVPGGEIALPLAGRVPLALRAYGDDIQKDEALGYGQRLQPGMEPRIRRVTERIDCLVAMNQTLCDCFTELGARPAQLVEIPNGIDYDRLDEAAGRSETRKRWDLPDVPVLLTVGRNHPKKGYDLIPAIAKRLREQGHAFHWLVIGKDTDAIKPALREVGVDDCVKTMPEIGAGTGTAAAELPSAELIDLYGAADLFVFPTWIEGLPRVLLEAMAAGLAVVTTDVPGCRDLIVDDDNGLLRRAGDPDGLADAVGRLLADNTLRERIAATGRTFAGRFDWPLVTAAYERAYLRLIEAAARRD